jgi:hypothetical protein
MKREILSIILAVIASIAISQTATNFTCNDCKDNLHDLFTELDAGKVIVLCWVMPCGSCAGPAITTYNVVESYQANYPNTVYMYLCDDYANTNCTSLTSWANGYNITNPTFFSNTAIKMEDYGSPGMPKIVVIAGPDHAVLYNAVNSVNASLLQGAIDSALSSIGISERENNLESIFVSPNPVNGFSVLTCNLNKDALIKIKVMNQEGRLLRNVFSGTLTRGENRVELNLSSFNPGIYFINFDDGDLTKNIKVAVVH